MRTKTMLASILALVALAAAARGIQSGPTPEQGRLQWDFLRLNIQATDEPSDGAIEGLYPEWSKAGYVVVAFDPTAHRILYSLSGSVTAEQLVAEFRARIEKEIDRRSRELQDEGVFSLDGLRSELRFIDESQENEEEDGPSAADVERAQWREQAESAIDMFRTAVESLPEYLHVLATIARRHRVLLVLPTDPNDRFAREGDYGLIGTSDDAIQEFRGLLDRFARLSRSVDARAILDARTISYLQLPLDTRWVRDFGPLFVRLSSGEVAIVDTRYDVESPEPASMWLSVDESRRSDEIMPTLLSTRLRQVGSDRAHELVEVYRPALAIAGGDLQVDGNRIGITSTTTLQANGGNERALRALCSRFLGVEELLFLYPMPGHTVKHIDMFLNVAAPNVILLGQIGEMAGARRTPLFVETRNVLEQNASIIKSFYAAPPRNCRVVEIHDASQLEQLRPDLQNHVFLVRVPMLSPSASEQRLVSEVLAQVDEVERRLAQLRSNRARYELLSNARAELAALATLAPDAREQSHAEELDRIRSAVFPVGTEGTGEASGEAKRIAEASVRPASGESLTPNEQRAFNERVSDLLKCLDDELVTTIDNNIDDQVSAAEDQLMQLQVEEKRIKNSDMPSTRQDVFRTNINFLFVHDELEKVLYIPKYEAKAEESVQARAIELIERTYRACHGDVKVELLPCDAIIRTQGAVHCLTRLIPADVQAYFEGWGYAGEAR